MKKRKIPLRKCMGCGEMKEKQQLIRVVKEADVFSVDTTGKKSGRGAYCCSNDSCFKLLKKNRGLERSFKESIDMVVYDALEEVIGRDK